MFKPTNYSSLPMTDKQMNTHTLSADSNVQRFISNSTDHIFQQHLKETDPLLVRIQHTDEDEEEDDNSYLFIPLILVPLALIVTLSICVMLLVL